MTLSLTLVYGLLESSSLNELFTLGGYIGVLVAIKQEALPRNSSRNDRCPLWHDSL